MTETNPDTLQQKKEATKRFFIYGNFLPLMIPLIILVAYNQIVHIFNLNVFILVLSISMPTIVLWAALHLYDKDGDENSWWSEKKVDFLLYFVATVTILSLAYQVKYSGGFDNSILIFYFYFIPSAIAISFKAKWGLILTLVLCFLSIAYNYLTKLTITDEMNNIFNGRYQILYITIIFIHLTSLGLLEYHNNKSE